MKTTHFTKTLGVFLMGWTLSGFGLAHMLDAKQAQPTPTQHSIKVPLKITLSLVNAAENTASGSGLRVDMVQCSQRQPYNRNAYNCQPLVQDGRNTIDNPMVKQSQYTDANGQVTFSAAYPDKYTAATTHFHVMVYDRYNNLITSSQFNFPDVVYPTMDAYYKAGGKNPATLLTNEPTSNPPIVVTGNATTGFTAVRTIFLPENTNGNPFFESSATTQLSGLKVFPNPVVNGTTFAFQLTQPSEVEITVTDNTGVLVRKVYEDRLASGTHEIEVDFGILQKGIYFYKLHITNGSGTFSEAKKLIKT